MAGWLPVSYGRTGPVWHNMLRMMSFVSNGSCVVATRNVRLTEHQMSLIDGLVRSGRYQNASEVIREGLRIVEEREAEQALSLDWFNAQIAPGVEQARRGEFAGDADDVFAGLDAAIDAVEPDQA